MLSGDPFNWLDLRNKAREINSKFISELGKPHARDCFVRFVKTRRKRHSTYLVSKRHNKRWNKYVDKRNLDEQYLEHSFQNIYDFIVKNQTFHDKFTYVPIIFAKVKTTSTNPELLATTVVLKCENYDHENSQTTTGSSLLIDSSSLRISSTQKEEHSKAFPRNLAIIPAAKNLTEELQFKIPQLRRSLLDIIARQKTASVNKKRKKRADGSNLTSQSSDMPTERVLFPGIIIYPLKQNKKKRNALNLEELISEQLTEIPTSKKTSDILEWPSVTIANVSIFYHL